MSEPLLVACPSCGTTNRVAPHRVQDGAVCGSCGKALFPPKPIELTGANFDRQVAKSGLPLVVEGAVVGAIGVSGGTGVEDGQVAAAAAESLPGLLGIARNPA